MRRTRGSLYFTAGYLYFGGAGFLLAPQAMLMIFLAEGIYSMVTLRLLGAVMLGMAMLVSAIIEQATASLYRQVWLATIPMVAALGYVYYDSLDRMWALLLTLVAAGSFSTWLCLHLDGRTAERKEP
ncbi:MAG: hypothetical protein MUF01_06940 [Bryobacterales bacterium]|jgi:chromate transport protein ChrA|nr:hypothetical protein [Bryobacterales bacterium]